MLKTALLGVVLSFGLVACVTDDSTDVSERGDNTDQLPPEDTDSSTVNPTGVTENPGDVPGRITANVRGGATVPVQNVTTTNVDMVHGGTVLGDTSNVVVEQTTEDVEMHHGITDQTTGGLVIGDSCEGQGVECRASDPRKLTR